MSPRASVATINQVKPGDGWRKNRITVHDPSGSKFVIRVERRGTPESLPSDLTWVIGWLVGTTVLRGQYKVLVTQFVPTGKTLARTSTYEATHSALRGFNSCKEALQAAENLASRIEAGAAGRDI